MLAQVMSAGLVALDALPVTVEVDIASKGLPSFTIVGLPDKAVEESKERVRAALKNSGADFPAKRITVNLAPADLPKAGPSYDLPIALGILIASGQLETTNGNGVFTGELSLDGTLRHVNGVLSTALMVRKLHLDLYVPLSDAQEAAVVNDIRVYPVTSLLALFRHLSGSSRLEPAVQQSAVEIDPVQSDFDISDVRGQEHVKRALEIAAAGGHNVYMQGPPGAGKTMMARALPSILPQLSREEMFEVTKMYSATGNLPSGMPLVRTRPFRAPHHTTSRIGLIGGGTHPAPGEISLAHRGVLFLDEFPEFPRHVLEAMRQPMEDGFVTISRAAGTVRYPSKFTLVAAANPCPCGQLGSPEASCTCLPGSVSRYRKRVSGPILDRIDLHVSVPQVAVEKLIGSYTDRSETSAVIRGRVEEARNRQSRRNRGTGFLTNAELNVRLVRKLSPLNGETESLLVMAVKKAGLSARAYYRTIKIARTIADLEQSDSISARHMAEALQYRPYVQ